MQGIEAPGIEAGSISSEVAAGKSSTVAMGSSELLAATGGAPQRAGRECDFISIASHATCISFLMLDMGWVSFTPSLGLAGMLTGIALQSYSLRVSFKADSRFDCAVEMSMWLWIVGNGLWMTGEFIWDMPQPMGFLAHIPLIVQLSQTGNSIFIQMMILSTIIMAASVIAILFGYCTIVVSTCRSCFRQQVAGDRPRLAGLLLESQDEGLHQDTTGGEALLTQSPGACFEVLYLLPWMASDFLWSLCNAIKASDESMDGSSDLVALVILMDICGALAVVLGTAVVCQKARAKMVSRALWSSGEVLWVLGNVVWATEDVLTDDSQDGVRLCATILFAVAAACILGSAVSKDCDLWRQGDSRDSSIRLGPFRRTISVRSSSELSR